MIPHNRPTLGLKEQAATVRVLKSNWLSQGPEVELFERDLCQFFRIPDGHAVVVSSGSAALYLALWVLNGEGKDIGLPVYACAALRNAIGLVNGRCRYFDCEEGSPNIDISSVINSNIDILVAPSLFGIPVKLPKKCNFRIIEDIAQSIGAQEAGVPIGLRGDLGICSFYASKLITAGGYGGAIISHDKSLIDAIKDYRKFDARTDKKLRFNFQMSDLQAAIGRVQLGRLPEFMAIRRKIFDIYRDAGLSLLWDNEGDMLPVRYRAIITCQKPAQLIDELLQNSIYSIIPVEGWELLDDVQKYPVADQLTCETVSLPIYPSLLKGDARRVANIAMRFV